MAPLNSCFGFYDIVFFNTFYAYACQSVLTENQLDFCIVDATVYFSMPDTPTIEILDLVPNNTDVGCYIGAQQGGVQVSVGTRQNNAFLTYWFPTNGTCDELFIDQVFSDCGTGKCGLNCTNNLGEAVLSLGWIGEPSFQESYIYVNFTWYFNPNGVIVTTGSQTELLLSALQATSSGHHKADSVTFFELFGRLTGLAD